MTEAVVLNPLSDIESERAQNVAGFVSRYRNLVAAPLPLRNHTSIIEHQSDLKHVDLRKKTLEDYINVYTGGEVESAAMYDWGRVLLSEAVFATNLAATLQPVLERERMSVVLPPTSIDTSNPQQGPYYQKGADVLIVKGDEAICGFDVTLQIGSFVGRKRRRAGLQATSDMPVLVVSLGKMQYSDEDPQTKLGFYTYLDEQGRKSVVETGTYLPFYGLSDADVNMWKEDLFAKIGKGINLCKISLDNHLKPETRTNTNIDLIHERLDEMERLNTESHEQLLLAAAA